MNRRLWLIAIGILVLLLSLIGVSIVNAFDENKNISFSYEGMYKGKNFIIEKYKDLEQNNTCYVMFGSTNSNAIGSFGGISCVKEEVRIVYINITGGK